MLESYKCETPTTTIGEEVDMQTPRKQDQTLQ
jgi:hypothetical protein